MALKYGISYTIIIENGIGANKPAYCESVYMESYLATVCGLTAVPSFEIQLLFNTAYF